MGKRGIAVFCVTTALILMMCISSGKRIEQVREELYAYADELESLENENVLLRAENNERRAVVSAGESEIVTVIGAGQTTKMCS